MKNTILTILFLVGHVFAFAQKPNIIIILADDLGYGDVGCFGSKLIKTPNIDQMAKEGLRLTQFYSGSTVCTPSRSALMTGQHTGHTYLRGNTEHPLRQQDYILPEHLKKAGYQTGLFGKWGIGDINTSGSPDKKGWDTFYGLLHNVEAHYQYPAMVWRSTPEHRPLKRIPIQAFQGFGCDFYMMKALEWLDNRDKAKPFFAFLSFPIPHAELVPRSDIMGQYTDADGQSVFPGEVPYQGSHYGGQSQPKAAYAAHTSTLDSYVGEVMAYLKKNNLDKNTLVIFASDNGTHIEGGRTTTDVELMNSSGTLRGVKRDLYEGGIRVTTVVWGLNLPQNQVREDYAAFWDLMATFSDLAQIKIPDNQDGVSLWSNWQKNEPIPQRPLYWEFYEGGYSHAARQDQWKYIYRVDKKGNISEELFDLASDQKELQNVISNHNDLAIKMRDICDKQHTKSQISELRRPNE